ncbi:MAG: VOC family protein [Bacteroidota bacterium]
MQQLAQLLAPTTPFLNQIMNALKADQINVASLELDHICYRVETFTRYEELKEALALFGVLLAESQIGGRPIATYKLHEPIRFREREIWCLELPAPKAKTPYMEGFEHVEFVINEPFDVFMNAHPQVQFDTKGMHKAVNADIRVCYPSCCVKFHHHSLEYVIRYLD